MTSPPPIRALLIDDEPPAREEMRRLLSVYPHVTVVGEAGNIGAARRRLRKAADYDLVFLDVQLIGGNGFDLVPDVAPTAKIIFVTAYEEHALRAFEINALDYLLKPVTAERLSESLQRLNEIATTSAQDTPAHTPPLNDDDTLLVRGTNGAEFVEVHDIATIESQQNYSRVRLISGRDILVLRPLKAWEEQLPEDAFALVRRGVLVNLGRVETVKHNLLGTPELQLTGMPDQVATSRRQWARIRNRLPRS